MSDRVQIGPTVDADVWREFREHVKERNGKTRGSLGDELERAIRHYIHFGSEKPLPDQLAEFNARLQRIEGAVGTAEADGGADTVGADSHAHTPSRLDAATAEKPSANAPTDEKVEYLAAQIGSNPDAVPKNVLRDTVKDEYGFRKDTAKRYVELLIEYFGFVDDPRSGYDLLVTPERREELLEAEAEAKL